MSDYEEKEEPEAQGRKSQDDPLDSSVQGLVTPSTTKVNASGEEQVEDINLLTKGRRYKRRKEAKGKKVVSSLDFQEEVDTGAEQVNTAEGVNTGSIKLSTVSKQLSTGSEQVSTVSAKSLLLMYKGHKRGDRKKLLIMISEKLLTKQKRTKFYKRKLALGAINWILYRKKRRLTIHLDSLLAQRIVEEEALNEATKKRKAQDFWDMELSAEVFEDCDERYGMDGPEDELEKVFWKCLRTMFEEPLSTDPIWSELGQQKIIRVNTPGSDENSLKLYDLIADMKGC
ncbi:hypothetical protein Tco_0175621 [Tanacetum coccineum]